MDFLQDALADAGTLLGELVDGINNNIDMESAWASLGDFMPAELVGGLQEFWPLILVLILVYAVVELFGLPLKIIWNGLIGGATLFIVNIVGSFVGFSMKITLWKALVAGFLGIPGTIAVIIYEIFG